MLTALRWWTHNLRRLRLWRSCSRSHWTLVPSHRRSPWMTELHRLLRASRWSGLLLLLLGRSLSRYGPRRHTRRPCRTRSTLMRSRTDRILLMSSCSSRVLFLKGAHHGRSTLWRLKLLLLLLLLLLCWGPRRSWRSWRSWRPLVWVWWPWV